MKLTLKPISHPNLGEIDVTQTLFPIGREDPPFIDYDSDSIASLSRRHGRIFEHEGQYFVVDLHSSNGTTLNGADVTRSPSPIKDGDEICFGNQLRYKLYVDESANPKPAEYDNQPPIPSRAQGQHAAPRAQQAAPSGPPQLRLVPERYDAGIDTIIVTGFPFLINRDSEVFAKYQARLGDELKFLSRKHAHIFENGNYLYIEDLGSRNGTFLNGERLGGQAQALQDGDSIAFSGECFVYTVKLEQANVGYGSDADYLEEDGATIVNAPNSFMDIYEEEEDDADLSQFYLNSIAKPEALRKIKQKVNPSKPSFDWLKALHLDKVLDIIHRIRVKEKMHR